MKKNIIYFLLIFICSCNYPEMIRDEIIYENNFENNNLENIDGAEINNFNNTNVIGNFNNDGFTVHLNEIGDHDYIHLSFDLYIHGTWDGNFNGFTNGDKPDLWMIEFNPQMDLFQDENSDIFITTFSNSPCFSNYCLRQSYPDSYPSENTPKLSAFEVGLEKLCKNSFFGGKTTLYKIEKIFKSSGQSAIIRFSDQLYQPNAIDKDGNDQQKCDESWSLDNLIIRAIEYK